MYMSRFSFVLVFVFLAGCSQAPKPAVNNAPVKQYSMEGEVVRLEPDQTAVIKHKDIEGWMKAMTMEYPIRSKDEYAALKAGAHIQADVFVQGDDYWVANIRPYQADAPPAANKAATPRNVPKGN